MSDERPLIGITATVARAQWGPWDRPAALLPFEYVTATQRAGGSALIVAPDPEHERNPDQLLDLLDGLILSGGGDIDPSSYGAERHPETNGSVPERDRTEIALARRAVERDMPVLGICRGMQLINVALGGTLVQHLPDLVGHGDHRANPGSFDGSDHDVRLLAGSVAASAVGEIAHVTKSHHHQGVDRIGDGLEVTGYSTLDDLPEAIEVPGCRFVLGVQWHPEADDGSSVVATLVAQARDYRSSRGSL
jgi:putative glutamine amidotransferase